MLLIMNILSFLVSFPLGNSILVALGLESKDSIMPLEVLIFIVDRWWLHQIGIRAKIQSRIATPIADSR